MANVPPRPERPVMPAHGEKARRSNWLVVIVALVMAVGGLASMMLLPLLNFFPVIVLAVFGFIAFHHFVWGRWLTKIVREEEGQDEAE
jgi:hypothetical protein